MWSSGSKSCLIFCAHLSFPVAKEKKDECAGRESNPGLVRGRDVYYHCTTGADKVASCISFYSDSEQTCSATDLTKGCILNRSYGAMAARWIPDPKVGGSNPSSFIRLFFLKKINANQKNCRNWESHPGCRGHNAESCY